MARVRVREVDTPTVVGYRIRQARTAAGLLQRELADRCSFQLRSLTDYETGKTAAPPNRLAEIAAATGVTVQWLATGDDAVADRLERLERLLEEVIDRLDRWEVST